MKVSIYVDAGKAGQLSIDRSTEDVDEVLDAATLEDVPWPAGVPWRPVIAQLLDDAVATVRAAFALDPGATVPLDEDETADRP